MKFFDISSLIDRMREAVNAKSDKELAGLLDMSPSTLGNWRADGKKNPLLDKLLPFAEKNNLDLNWLLLGRNVEEPQRDQLTTMALEELAHLNDQQKFKVVSFIKALREEGNSLHTHNQFNQNNIGVVAEQVHQPIKQTFK